MSAFDAEKFRASLAGSNPASSAYFRMWFTKMPRIFLGVDGLGPVRDEILRRQGIRPQKWGDNFQDFEFRCMGADLPARQVETQERVYNGPSRLIPYGLIYSNLNVEVIEGKNLRTRELFDTWQELIYNGSKYTPLYYDDIIADMALDVYDKSGNKVRQYRFRDVFPITVAPSQMSWANENSFLVIPIEFSYHHFECFSLWDNSRQRGSDFRGSNT